MDGWTVDETHALLSSAVDCADRARFSGDVCLRQHGLG